MVKRRKLTRKTDRVAYTLSDFIQNEMNQRQMSMREFGRFVGVSDAAISRHVAGKGGTPSEELLVKLCKATGANVVAVFALAYPDVAELTALSPKAMLAAQLIDSLPDSIQDFILGAAISQKGVRKSG